MANNENEENGFSRHLSDFENRQHLRLSEEEFNKIKQFREFWKKQPEKSVDLKKTSFIKVREYFTNAFLRFMKQFWPDTKYAVLELKPSFISTFKARTGMDTVPPMLQDTVAFQFRKGGPEIYVMLGQVDPIVIDEFRFDVYCEKAQFRRPNWDEIWN